MPNKDREKQLAIQRAWYKRHKEQEVARVKARKQEIRRWFTELKATLRCAKCGESDPACLEFHHKNPAQKKIMPSELRRGYGKRTVEEELAKCIPLCVNCHRKEH
jgi:5-methylcytosine-specific restriction endonuclease McrA